VSSLGKQAHPDRRVLTVPQGAKANMTTTTGKRYLVIASLFLLSLILYIDRAAISSADTK
jgi:hypothetical protein